MHRSRLASPARLLSEHHAAVVACSILAAASATADAALSHAHPPSLRARYPKPRNRACALPLRICSSQLPLSLPLLAACHHALPPPGARAATALLPPASRPVPGRHRHPPPFHDLQAPRVGLGTPSTTLGVPAPPVSTGAGPNRHPMHQAPSPNPTSLPSPNSPALRVAALPQTLSFIIPRKSRPAFGRTPAAPSTTHAL